MNKPKYPEIVNQMTLKNERLGDLVRLLGLKELSQVSRRLSGQVEWTIKEAKILCKHYNINFYKLFREEE